MAIQTTNIQSNLLILKTYAKALKKEAVGFIEKINKSISPMIKVTAASAGAITLMSVLGGAKLVTNESSKGMITNKVVKIGLTILGMIGSVIAGGAKGPLLDELLGSGKEAEVARFGIIVLVSALVEKSSGKTNTAIISLIIGMLGRMISELEKKGSSRRNSAVIRSLETLRMILNIERPELTTSPAA